MYVHQYTCIASIQAFQKITQKVVFYFINPVQITAEMMFWLSLAIMIVLSFVVSGECTCVHICSYCSQIATYIS